MNLFRLKVLKAQELFKGVMVGNKLMKEAWQMTYWFASYFLNMIKGRTGTNLIVQELKIFDGKRWGLSFCLDHL